MKKIRNIDHLAAEKNLLRVQQLQLEKEMHRNLREISHDIRQPATVVSSAAPLLKWLVSSVLISRLPGGALKWITRKLS